jgi:hypothetical protein
VKGKRKQRRGRDITLGPPKDRQPSCLTCRHLRPLEPGGPACGEGHQLDARTCGAHRDISLMRNALATHW